MTCKELIEVLAEYLDDALTPEVVADIERHLSGCAPCRAYLATYVKTRTVSAEANRVEMPDDMKDRVRDFLLHRLRRRS
jgi:anti-sigma factor RsiW